MPETLPLWALQRVSALLGAQGKNEAKAVNVQDMARLAGLSRNLTIRCIRHITRHRN